MSVAAIETRRSILLTGWCLLAAIVLALVIAVGVSVGELAIPLQNVFYAISNRTGLTAEPLNRIYESVIWDFRLSRALVAACCGAGLAICGVVLQSLLKNAPRRTLRPRRSAGPPPARCRSWCWALALARFPSRQAPLPGPSPPSPLSPC